MTSDAKIGLLLGLVFIVVIAFLLNGLPGLLSRAESEGPIETSVRVPTESFGLDEKAREAIEFTRQFDVPKLKKRRTSRKDDPRYSSGRDEESIAVKPDNKKENSIKGNVYVVKSGDNLGKIARKVYGNDIGKKQLTIDCIFQANSKTLKSPDDIFENQKLVMPALMLDANGKVVKNDKSKQKSTEEELLKTNVFERVGGAFRNVFANRDKSTSSLSADFVLYKVRDGDSLYKIARKQLGNGERYREIQKINKTILKGSIDVSPGMKLQIPQS